MAGRLNRALRDPWHVVKWGLRRAYNAYQFAVLRHTAKVGRGVRLLVHAEWTNLRRDQLVIGDDVLLGDVIFHIYERGKVSIGEGTAISGLRVEAAVQVQIGRDCQISYDVDIHDNNGHPVDPVRRRRQIRCVRESGMDPSSIYESETAAVAIGNNVWIGHGVTIMKGVTVGDNAIIATGSVVTHDVPANTVAAGNPARIVKEIFSGGSGPGKGVRAGEQRVQR